MLDLKECQILVNKELNALKLPGLPLNLYEPIRYMLHLDGKRIRPSMVLLACSIFRESIDIAVNPALALEIFHNFTLLHDDIMDGSEIRRNSPTVYKKWNANIAILSGDAMLIKAYEILSKTDPEILERILPVFNRTALQVCEGQQFDMDYEIADEVTIQDYLAMIEFKTAVLIAASLKIGAIAGGAHDKEADILYEFGRNLGIAFQLQDDLLDVYADSTVFGKKTGNDIVSNKKTILLVEALTLATGSLKENLKIWLSKENFIREEKVQAITEIYNNLDIQNQVEKRIGQFHLRAVECLDELPVEADRKTELYKLSDLLMRRER